ncbi:MAG: hypothetical protein ACE5L7_05735, partial [Candidatus Aminicenantales bacterium]
FSLVIRVLQRHVKGCLINTSLPELRKAFEERDFLQSSHFNSGWVEATSGWIALAYIIFERIVEIG